ncbi:MAG: 50S ribosomal protein L15 [Candidatus Omnitrophica bacterium]|nr:50S ribosomal protein L15 [Candidatus Omnitrophota bacterium]
MKLGELSPPKGAVRRPKRLGFGESSGHGKTSGKGHKGQKARSGPGLRPEFEGGQMPLVRRVPKRGFKPFRKHEVKRAILNVGQLDRFSEGTRVDLELLAKEGLIPSTRVRVKVLGEGELAKPLTVCAHAFSGSAREKIERAGGKAEAAVDAPKKQGTA